LGKGSSCLSYHQIVRQLSSELMETSLCLYHSVVNRDLESTTSTLAKTLWIYFRGPPVHIQLCLYCLEDILWRHFDRLSERQRELLDTPDRGWHAPPPSYDSTTDTPEHWHDVPGNREQAAPPSSDEYTEEYDGTPDWDDQVQAPWCQKSRGYRPAVAKKWIV